MTILLGVLLLASPALFAASEKVPTDKKAAAAKDAKSPSKAKANAKSSVKEQNDPFLDKAKKDAKPADSTKKTK